MIRSLNGNIKNILGWTTKRKIVVFSVDDYGNIRLASKQARLKLGEAGIGINDYRFDKFDGLENAKDLTNLFEALSSVKDLNGRSAVFTPFANVANIDFDAIKKRDYDTYSYELLPDTLSKLPGYEGTWDLWKEGISSKIFIPQFHGREHLNLKLFNELLAKRNTLLMACLENKSFTGLPLTFYKTINYNETYCFDKFEENQELAKQIKDGLTQFENVFGYKALNFNAPGAYEHEVLEEVLYECGIRYIDSIFIKNEHQGEGKYKKKLRYWGKKSKHNQRYLIRNCVFEPTLSSNDDMVDACLLDIERAFRWNKPANISSHRINFNGVIDEDNGAKGIKSLKYLLQKIVTKWPDVEFMAANELGDIISSEGK